MNSGKPLNGIRIETEESPLKKRPPINSDGSKRHMTVLMRYGEVLAFAIDERFPLLLS